MPVQSTIQLLTQVITHAPDIVIWNAVFALVAEPATPPTNILRKIEPETPLRSTDSSQQGSEQNPADMDDRLLREINLCLYENAKGFYEKYFEGKSWSFFVACFAQKLNPQILNGRWAEYPYPPTHTAFFKWFWELDTTFPSERRSKYYTSFNKRLDISGCNRLLDLFLAPRDLSMCQGRYSWRDVRVIGKFKESFSDRNQLEIAEFCGYARDVFISQPTRLFLHGFFLRGSIMELWVFDRSGPYICKSFDAHKHPNRFIKVILAYTMMSDEELGLNMFIKEDDIGKWIMIKGEGQAKEERLDLDDQPIAFQRAIVCGGTTCYRARRQGVSRWEFVVKFSWRSDKRPAEGELLKLAKEKQVWGIAQIFGHQDLTSVERLRQGLQFGKPRSFQSVSIGSLYETQSKPDSNNLKSNLSPILGVGSGTTALPSSSPSGQKRKAEEETAAMCHSKRPRSSGIFGQTDTANQATRDQVDTKNIAEEAKPTSLVPSKDNDSFRNRILCCLVISPPGRAIDQFISIKEYLQALRDAIKGHKSLYHDAEILHCDISVNNIIITDAENDADPRGMLIDLDLAKELKNSRMGGKNPTGTKEFMAIEVLEGRKHTYRHDLESFFYVFLWIIIRHNLASGENLTMDSKLRCWSTRNNVDTKRACMDKLYFRTMLDEFPHEFDCLMELAKELRAILFPMRNGGLFTGTPSDPEKLYTPIVKAFDEAIIKLREETG